MIRINLLPHREAKRKQRKQEFYALLGLAAFAGVAVVLAVGVIINGQINDQAERNRFITAENAKLDAQIKEIATLKDEIAALLARQQAVEDLQSDRNQPVYLMDELVKQVPEGIFLKTFKQAGQRVMLNGFAQSNERVSDLLRNLGNNSPWLQHPDLVEIRSANTNVGKDIKRVYEFTINVDIRRPRDQQAAVPLPAPVKAAPAATPPAVAGPANAAPKKP